MLEDLDELVTDDELAALALAADPDVTVGDDAVSLWDLLGSNEREGLPAWYMPAPLGLPRLGYAWQRAVAILTIVAFVTIDCYGLCSTYGHIVFA